MIQFSQNNNIDHINNRSKRSIQDQIQKNKNLFDNENKQNVFFGENNAKRKQCVSFKNIGTYKCIRQSKEKQWISQKNNTNDNINQIHQQEKNSLNSIQIIRSKKSILKKTLKNSLLIPKTLSFFNKLQEKLTAASLRDIGLQQQSIQGFKFISQQIPSQKQTNPNTIQVSSKSISSTQKQLNINFDTKYQIIKKIGQGAHSTVYKCICKQTLQFFALKRIRNISYQNWLKTRQFFHMMKQLSHENLIKYYEMFFDKEKRTAYVIMEYCEGGDLRLQMAKRWGKEDKELFQQQEIFNIIKKVLEVIEYLHSEGVCHRDLKPENVLYDKVNNKVKIIDLDVCGVKKYKIINNSRYNYLNNSFKNSCLNNSLKSINPNNSLFQYPQHSQHFQLWTNTGTLFYRALQTFGIGYTQKCDIWSIGVIIYQLLTSKTPFETQYQKDFIENIKNKPIDKQINMMSISKKMKNVLKMCLEKDGKLRGSAGNVLGVISRGRNDDWGIGDFVKVGLKQQKGFEKQNHFDDIVYKRSYYEENDKGLIGLGNMLKFKF